MVVTALLSNATRLDTLLVGTEKLKWHIGLDLKGVNMEYNR